MKFALGLVLVWFSCGLLAACLVGCGDDDDAPGGARDGGARDGGADDGGARDAGPADAGPRCTLTLSPGDDDQTMLQGALIDAVRGDAICLAKGRYRLDAQLSLDVDGVTVRGESGAVLDFSEQTTGANGFAITADDVTLEGVRIENPKGDGVRASSVRNLVVRGVHVEWTAGPSPDNGGYGIYPVSSTGILIEDCFAAGASDTGIYVGQSSRIVIRRNEVTENVAGIEIENSTDAEVYENHAHGNTGGILLFNLPGLPVKDGKRANVHDNLIEDNNHANFGEAGNIVAEIPTGTGMFVLASDDNEVHRNRIRGNKSGGISIVSWYVSLRDEEGAMDPQYDWFPERNYVHDNVFADNGDEPQDRAALIAGLVGEDTLPDMAWDGIVDLAKLDADGGLAGGAGLVPPLSLRNCFAGNGSASFMVLDLEHDGADKSSDVGPYECEHPSLPPIKL
jgi:parallel beta-helix repeat protein